MRTRVSSQSVNCPRNLRKLFLLSLHKVIYCFYQSPPFCCCCVIFLGQLKSWIILKSVDLSVSNFWRWVSWWLLISLMKKYPWTCSTGLWPIVLKWWRFLLMQDVSLIRLHLCAVLLLLVQGEIFWFDFRTCISIPRVSRTLYITIVELLCSRFIICAFLSPLPVIYFLVWS